MSSQTQTQTQYHAPTPPPAKHRRSPATHLHMPDATPPATTPHPYAYDMPHYWQGMYIYGPPPGYPPHYAHGPRRAWAWVPRRGSHRHMVTRTHTQGTRSRGSRRTGGTTLALGEEWAPVPPAESAACQSYVHTDDAATKLSDRVRWRCFNCCTTETKTWRRSNLSSGKVFLHERAPLASSALGARVQAEQPSYQQTYGSSASAPQHPQPYIAPLAHPDSHSSASASHPSQNGAHPAQHNYAAHPLHAAQNGAHPAQDGQTQNGSASASVSHPGTPPPQHIGEGPRRSASPREREEQRGDCRREERAGL
ncbi:hypothetical protein FB451DRAFT_1393780 [Mycena latifolia]|nr:hypothetical protein FB451DRAFT_1393780 [Mycena latifolia]